MQTKMMLQGPGEFCLIDYDFLSFQLYGYVFIYYIIFSRWSCPLPIVWFLCS